MLTAEPKAYGSNWHAATRVEGPARTRLTVELDVDLCIVGAGLAGLTVAREVARHGWSVVVLEAKSVGWSASGRSTGVVLPGFSVSADALIERVGLTTGAIEHKKLLADQALPRRMLANECVELRRKLCVKAVSEVLVDPIFERRDP